MNDRLSPQARLHLTLLLSSVLAAAGCRGLQAPESEAESNQPVPAADIESVSQALAGVWTGADIGATAAGTSNENAGTFTLEGGGADIWGTADAFRFHYMTVTGNATLIARVVSVENTDPFAKVGVMMRETLAAGSKHAFALVTSDAANGNRFQYRTATNGTSTKVQNGLGNKPVYLRLVRSGTTFTASYSPNGATWTTIGSQSITMVNTIEMGLAVTSHNTGQLATAVFDNVTFSPPQTAPTPPAAPTNLTATPGNNQVALSWTASSGGATSYTIKRSTTAGTGYTNIQTQSGTSFTDTTAVNGTTYFYVVSASNAAGSSGNSNEVTATPAAPPPPQAPTNLVATAGNAQVALTWTASPGAGNTYTVKRSNDAGGPYTNVQTGITGASYTDPGLNNGTAYFYVVTATNSGGESGPSNEATATPQAPPPPGAPTNLTATAGNTQVVLSWSAVTGAATYTVKRSPNTTPRSFANVQTGITGTSYPNTGLTNGTTYVYVVTATNSGGESGPSNEAIATPVAPPAPTWTETNVGGATPAGSFTVGSGTNPSYTVVGGGADFSSSGTTDQFKFVYQTVTGNATITARLNSLANVTGQSFVKAGVMMRAGTANNAQYGCILATNTATNGWRYQYRLTAGAAAAQIRQSGSSVMPGWLRLVRAGNVFTASTSPNGTTWTTVGSQTISMPAAIQIGFAVTSHLQGTSTTAVFDSLTMTTPTPPTPPPAPTGFTASGENNQAHLIWNPVAGATSYTVKQAASSSGPFNTVDTVPAGSESDAVHYARTGLTNGTTYWFTVSASNSAGAGADTGPQSATPQLLRPSVRSVAPVDGATGVATNAFVSLDLVLPNLGGGVDVSTLTNANVNLVRTSDGQAVPASANTSGGGDVIVLQPLSALAANTQYTFTLTSGAQDLTGAPFMPFTSRFTTGAAGPPPPTNVSFTRLQATGTKKNWTSITIGPDNKVYAATVQGEIYRWNMAADGSLTSQQLITTITANNGGARAIIGMRFDPAATSANLILWVTHGGSALKQAPDWTGKLSRLSGANLATYQDYVTNFPRSYKDHMTNSLDFKPNESGVIYITQGSMNAMGAPDTAWGDRAEHLMAAAILRVDTKLITSPPLNIQTNDANPTTSGYNPFATNAPVTIYATGVRNAYDILWHSNGELYTATNGSAAGGNSPATTSPLPSACSRRIDGTPYTGPSVPAINGNPVAEDDYFYRVIQGGYYGHPNPSRCEWVLNGGNPTSGTDHNQVTAYPVGVQPDRNYRGYTFNFGAHYSPNGMIEWQAPSVPSLMGKILVIRYSGGDDIIVLTIDPTTKGVSNSQTGITGFGGFVAPLDLTHNVNNGDIYVTEHDTVDTAMGAPGMRIFRLRPNP